MPILDLFASGFIPPVDDTPASVAASTVLTTNHVYSLIDTGAIPAGASIVSVQFLASQGSFLPGIVRAGIQPRYVHSATSWAWGGAVPPTDGDPLGLNDYALEPLTPALTLNPITGSPWTRAQLFADTWGWYNVWDNSQSTVVQSAQTASIEQFYVRVVYTVATQPAPSVGAVAFAGLTETPPTWTYRLEGNNFLDGCSVLLTPPVGSTLQLSGDAILSVLPTAIEFVTTQAQVGQAGTYTVRVLNPDGQISGSLTFDSGGPGIILTTPPGYLHYYGYAFVRPVTPNTTNEPLGLAPGASVTVYKSGTLNLQDLKDDADGTNPVANPMTADVNGFFSCYLAAEAVDVEFSGGGILSPYTIGDAVPLDPRIGPLELTAAALGADLDAATAFIEALIASIQAVPVAYPLGGSLVEGGEDAAAFDAINAVTVVLNGSLLAGYTATVRATLKTDDAGTSVTARLRNMTDASTAGTSAPVTSTSPTVVSFAVTLAAGVKQYRLQLVPSNASAFIYGDGYLEIAK